MTGTIDAETKVDSTDFRNTVPRFSADNRKAQDVQALEEASSQVKLEGARYNGEDVKVVH